MEFINTFGLTSVLVSPEETVLPKLAEESYSGFKPTFGHFRNGRGLFDLGNCSSFLVSKNQPNT
jgi:hypothetical protein